MHAVTPTGATHEVGPEDMFFSTTNGKGVIGQANAVFMRIARHPREELIGAPHNIIRHPDMPGGAFKLVWDALLAGEPTAAYVLNLAGDGSAYWAMASIVPIEDGYLSVRTRPARTDLRDAAYQLYRGARDVEWQARDQGAGAAQAAEIGAGYLAQELAKLGFADYAAFVRAMLPAETQARAATVAVPSRPYTDGPLHVTLDAVTDVQRQVLAMAEDLRAFQGGADALDGQLKATTQAIHSLEAAVRDAAALAREHVTDAPLLANAAPVVEAKCAAIGATVDDVAARVHELAAARTELSFRIALCQLQAEMTVRYVVAIADHAEDPTSSDLAVHTLAAALTQGMDGIERGLARNLEATESVRTELEATSRALRILRMSLATWRDLVVKFGLQQRFADVLPALDTALAGATSRIADLGSLVEGFGTSGVAFDNPTLHRNLHTALHLLESSAVTRAFG